MQVECVSPLQRVLNSIALEFFEKLNKFFFSDRMYTITDVSFTEKGKGYKVPLIHMKDRVDLGHCILGSFLLLFEVE